MVLITDKFHKVSSGTRAQPTTLTAQKALAASSISTAALNGWATDTPVDFQLYLPDSNNLDNFGNPKPIPGSQSEWTGIVSGTTITQLELTGGSDTIYPIGTIVVALPTANWADSLVEGILTHADPDGTLKANAVDSTAVVADSIITTAKLADGAVTSAKLAHGEAQAAYTATSETTSSGTYVDLATVGPAVTTTVGASGKALLIITSDSFNGSTAGYCFISFVASGANTIAATDTMAYKNKNSVNGQELGMSYSVLLTGLTPGSTTFTLKYKSTVGTSTFTNRRLAVLPQ